MELYQIPSKIRAACDGIQVDEETGEILNADAINATEADAAEVIESAALYIIELDVEAEALENEAVRMKARAQSIKNRKRAILKQLEPALESVGGKVKGEKVTVYIRRSKCVTVPENIDDLPEEYRKAKTTYSADKTAIKEALELGFEIKGCAIESVRSVCLR